MTRAERRSNRERIIRKRWNDRADTRRTWKKGFLHGPPEGPHIIRSPDESRTQPGRLAKHNGAGCGCVGDVNPKKLGPDE
jgi:hypothetical protein